MNIIESIKKISKPVNKADFLKNILTGYFNETELGPVNIVLFGAGSAGIHLSNVLRYHGIPPVCFCDNNKKLVGTEVNGIRVVSVSELTEKYRNSIVVVSVSNKHKETIVSQLSDAGINKISVPDEEMLLYYTNAVNLYWPEQDLIKNQQQISNVFNFLEDERSRMVFMHRLAVTSGGLDYDSFRSFIRNYADINNRQYANLFSSPVYDENFYYFNSDFFHLNNNETFANVGALIGDCALAFADSCEKKGLKYNEILNFEPDYSNFSLLNERMALLDNVKSLPVGLWSRKSKMKFNKSQPLQNNLVGAIDVDGNMEIMVDSLDSLFPESEISLIKIDVEGAEAEVIKGAEKTILQNKPKMAISIYHKRNDIIEIPMLIKSIVPEYKFYIRHHSSTFCETVLYALV